MSVLSLRLRLYFMRLEGLLLDNSLDFTDAACEAQ
jgi:hypothetical protein